METAINSSLAGLFGINFNDPTQVLIIAEAAVSHFGDVEEGKRLVRLAKSAGADVFKTQHFHTDELVHPSDTYWRERLRPKELTIEAIMQLSDYCDEIGIPFLCTPHNERALDELERHINPQVYKIGSGEKNNFTFIRKIAATGKPVILSTGMYTHQEVESTARFLSQINANLALLHCVTKYPVPLGELNINELTNIHSYFHGPVGWSDHTEGLQASLIAVMLGAKIIEKHITIKKNVPNAQDWRVSCDESDFEVFVSSLRHAAVERTDSRNGKPLKLESDSERWALKGAYLRGDLKAGSLLTERDVYFSRPRQGLPGDVFIKLLADGNCITRRDLKRDAPLGMEDLGGV